MAREGGTGRFARRMLSIHTYNLSSTSVNLPTDALNVFFFASSDIRAERLRISSRFDQAFLIVASLTLSVSCDTSFTRRTWLIQLGDYFQSFYYSRLLYCPDQMLAVMLLAFHHPKPSDLVFHVVPNVWGTLCGLFSGATLGIR